MNAMEEYHLTVETKINGKRVGIQDIHDPFLHNRTEYMPSLWERIKILFTGCVKFEVKVRGDDEAIKHWFRTDKLPEVDCEQKTIQDAAANQCSTPTDRAGC